MIERIIGLLVGAFAIALVLSFIIEKRFSGPLPQAEQRPTIAKATTVEPVIGANAALLRREDDGHYWGRADIGGTNVKLLVDTGASIVALTWQDAQRLRLKPEELDFIWSINTANGETFGASILLPTIRIGDVEIENVEAMVMQDGLLEHSLLGMSFLGKLYSYEFKQNSLIIRE
ncbi:MAG: TIGR02281 family clan AA aspartic protease [Hyphomonadaceae bacterium]